MTPTEHTVFDELIELLQVRAAAESPVRFWLRDDDAVHPSQPLEQLLGLCEQFAVPLMLAVIPQNTEDKLSERLVKSSGVAVALHGWSHANYADEGEKSQELGDHRPVSDLLTELRCGINRLSEFHQSRFVPVLVPPWNRISENVVGHVHELGIKAVSVFGQDAAEQAETSPVKFINAHVDIIDWKGTRGGRPVEELVAEINAQLLNGNSTIGVLSHHLVHDSRAWFFLEKLFAATKAHPGCSWVSIHDLLDEISMS